MATSTQLTLWDSGAKALLGITQTSCAAGLENPVKDARSPDADRDSGQLVQQHRLGRYRAVISGQWHLTTSLATPRRRGLLSEGDPPDDGAAGIKKPPGASSKAVPLYLRLPDQHDFLPRSAAAPWITQPGIRDARISPLPASFCHPRPYAIARRRHGDSMAKQPGRIAGSARNTIDALRNRYY